ncbi:relaxase/mobilization nuclease domain-containing protein [Caballeronia sordidicola]|uniref:relaxase/mobilization nuclease domain-containing protein n=1 Tax=Caballeronia sordidicola TaxID=196367 RepID=UPI0015C51A71|nr:relaxase/mobilization nuclease domain-containing protein [Caballeronia sordidicola]
MLRYGEGLKPDVNGEYLDKSHRTRISNFGLVDDNILIDADMFERQRVIALCSMEMQANCDLNQRVEEGNKIAHFMISFGQERPGDKVLDDIENSMMAELKLSDNHRVSFLHNDNGHWHMHIAASRIGAEPSHKCNDLWRERIKRDYVCREMELKHGLRRDKGYHYIAHNGEILLDSERKRGGALGPGDRAQSMERHSGLLSFQGWCADSGMAERLKRADSWADLHQIAGDFDCRIAARGSGFVVINRQDAGQAAKLSQIGVKTVTARLGDFKPPEAISHARTRYSPEPIVREHGERKPALRGTHEQWRQYQKAREDWRGVKADRLKSHAQSVGERRQELRSHFRGQRQAITADRGLERPEKEQRRSMLAMQLVQEELKQRDQFKAERQALHANIQATDLGKTFRAYLLKQVEAGDERALESARQYAEAEATDLSRKQEEERRRAAGTISSSDQNRIRAHHAVLNLKCTAHLNGSVDYDLGGGRVLTDTAHGQIKLSAPAVIDAEAVEAGLMLAQKRFGSELQLSGSDEFKRFAVETAVQRDVRVTFLNAEMEAYRQQLVEEKDRIRQHNGERSRAADVEATPAQTEALSARPEHPGATVEPQGVRTTTDIQPIVVRADALAFIERRNALAESGQIQEVPHRLATEADLTKPIRFAELRNGDTSELKVAVFERKDENGRTIEKIVLPVDKKGADRLAKYKRGADIKLEAERNGQGHIQITVPARARNRAR